MAQKKGQRDKERSTKHYIVNYRSCNTNPTKTGMNSGAPEGLKISTPHVTPVVLLLNDTNIT
jgi:hypothetical protein